MKRSVIYLATGLFISICTIGSAQLKEDLPYMNRSLSAEERVKDLLPRMTLEEKVLQSV